MTHPVIHMVRLSLCGAGLAAALTAQAVPSNLDIDFRDLSWDPADGLNSFTVGNVTATAVPTEAKLKQNSTDGLGVDGKALFEDPNEIGPREALVVTFSTSVELEGVWLTKLFDEFVDDAGSVKLYNGVTLLNTFNFVGDSDGEQYIDFAGALEVTEARFTVSELGNKLDLILNKDYSVAGFMVKDPDVTPTPMPDAGGTLTLLGGSLATLALGLRRRRA